MDRLCWLQLSEIEPNGRRHSRSLVRILFDDRADFVHGLDQIISAIQIILLLLVRRGLLRHYLSSQIRAVDFSDADTGLIEGRVVVVARGVPPAIIFTGKLQGLLVNLDAVRYSGFGRSRI